MLDPKSDTVPEGSGSWDTVLSALYHAERAAERRQQELADALARFRHAAQAMPDGVVILDDKYCIEWCNNNAAALLDLDPREDAGRPIANLVREPAFIDYLAHHDSSKGLPIGIAGDRRDHEPTRQHAGTETDTHRRPFLSEHFG